MTVLTLFLSLSPWMQATIGLACLLLLAVWLSVRHSLRPLQQLASRIAQRGQDDLQYCVEYKFDGLTLNLTYNEGRLIQAATRGNGITGEAILPQAKTIRTVPLTIPYQGTAGSTG